MPLILLWLLSVASLLFIVVPAEKNAGIILDGSLLPELYNDEYDIDAVIAIFKAVIPSLTSLIISLLLIGTIIFLTNTFLTAGLFRILAGRQGKPYSRKIFMMGADRGFGAFLFVALSVALILFLLILIVLIIPQAVIFFNEVACPYNRIIQITCLALLLLLLPVGLLLADYSRVLITGNKWLKPVRALTYAVKCLKGKFVTGYIIVASCALVSCFSGIAGLALFFYARTGGRSGMLCMLAFSMALLFFRVWVRTVRFGAVSALHESRPAE